jgi:hypothetical protein
MPGTGDALRGSAAATPFGRQRSVSVAARERLSRSAAWLNEVGWYIGAASASIWLLTDEARKSVACAFA